ncbi:MAG: hypothetical protein AAGK38_00040 [Pseudomonadota bacterium]
MDMFDMKPGMAVPLSNGIKPGDTIVLEPGIHENPLYFAGLRGTQERPIIIQAGKGMTPARLTGPICQNVAKDIANREAARRQEGGYYPAPGFLGDLAALTLRDCQYVVVQGLYFDQCWLSAIYIDDCRFIAVRDCRIEGSMNAFGINGPDTRHILIEHNHWRQDMSDDHDIWNNVPWSAIHGSLANSKREVDPKRDVRHFDGDFVRCWDIAGDLLVRDNDVEDAFNGVHTFNDVDELAPGVEAPATQFNRRRRSTANVLIEDNRFTRIRDNVIEPEDHAWNWVVRRNTFVDCLVPLSLELHRAGWLYIYANQFASFHKPSQTVPKDWKDESNRDGFAIFKTGGLQRNEGDIYFMFNSITLPTNARYFRRGFLGRLQHRNNAISFEGGKGRFFGKNGLEQGAGLVLYHKDGPFGAIFAQERRRFTRRWDGALITDPHAPDDLKALANLHISMEGDVIFDRNFDRQAKSGRTYEQVGYPVGNTVKFDDLGFPGQGDFPFKVKDLKLEGARTVLSGKAIAMTVELPGLRQAAPDVRKRHEVPAGMDVGAVQVSSTGLQGMEALDGAFGFIPNFDWVERVKRQDRPASQPLSASGAATV